MAQPPSTATTPSQIFDSFLLSWKNYFNEPKKKVLFIKTISDTSGLGSTLKLAQAMLLFWKAVLQSADPKGTVEAQKNVSNAHTFLGSGRDILKLVSFWTALEGMVGSVKGFYKSCTSSPQHAINDGQVAVVNNGAFNYKKGRFSLCTVNSQPFLSNTLPNKQYKNEWGATKFGILLVAGLDAISKTAYAANSLFCTPINLTNKYIYKVGESAKAVGSTGSFFIAIDTGASVLKAFVLLIIDFKNMCVDAFLILGEKGPDFCLIMFVITETTVNIWVTVSLALTSAAVGFYEALGKSMPV